MDESDNTCKECTDAEEVDLEAEVEHLRRHLAERDGHITALEGEYVKCNTRVNDLEDQVTTWREKYERLYDSHKRVQTLNQVLEDKLLQMVDRMKSEKSQLTKDIATLSVRLAESKHSYSMLQNENERYKNDMNLAIQLLQCKPDNFVSHKLDNLPIETQARVSQYVMSKTKGSTPGFTKNVEPDTFDAGEYEFNISASLMSKILEDSIQDTVTKHCDTCTCCSAQAKPFCYNDTRYSVATQTCLVGDAKHSLCLNCNVEVKSAVTPNASPVKLPRDKSSLNSVPMPMYLIPQPVNDVETVPVEADRTYDLHRDVLSKVDDETRHMRRYDMEPAVHHKLCDRTRTPISSVKSANSVVVDELVKDPVYAKELKHAQEADNTSLRKNSHSSMGAVSRASSVAKSTTSTHKSNTHVGPGPRFCSLRMQAGSKNILLDNAQPDVPPVLYTRQSKGADSIFKDLNEGVDNFVGLSRNLNEVVNDFRNDNSVVETTLIDVHVECGARESAETVKGNQMNPVLMNVSSSPLQPLKTHNFSNCSEQNNNQEQVVDSLNNTGASQADVLLNDCNVTNNQSAMTLELDSGPADIEVTSPAAEGMKIFNFDRYEENKSHYPLQFKKVDMSTLENTKLSKDLPPLGSFPKVDSAKSSPPNVVNVYPNMAQTHLKANSKKATANDKSTSSLSSDDSAALLQKQQLLRVAQWVEQNMEQQNSISDSLEEVAYNGKGRLVNMPHPVSKFSKRGGDWDRAEDLPAGIMKAVRVTNIVKETIFPVECDVDTGDDVTGSPARPERPVSKEELARMEYNVKKFLLSGPQWSPPAPARSRRTSSKTETDV